MIIADAVAIGGDRQCRHALHEAGGEPAKATVAERCVGFDLAQRLEIDAKLGQRRAGRLDQLHIGQRVDEKPSDEEFEAKIIDPLAPRAFGLLNRAEPAFDDLVAHRKRGGDEPVVLGRGRHALADRVPQLVENQIADLADLRVLRGRGGGRRERLCRGRGFGFKVHQGVAPSLTQALRGGSREARSKARAMTLGKAGPPAFAWGRERRMIVVQGGQPIKLRRAKSENGAPHLV